MVNLENITGRCTVSIGRPLDEVIHVKVEAGSLNCRKSKFYQMIDNITHVTVNADKWMNDEWTCFYRGVCCIFWPTGIGEEVRAGGKQWTDHQNQCPVGTPKPPLTWEWGCIHLQFTEEHEKESPPG